MKQIFFYHRSAGSWTARAKLLLSGRNITLFTALYTCDVHITQPGSERFKKKFAENLVLRNIAYLLIKDSVTQEECIGTIKGEKFAVNYPLIRTAMTSQLYPIYSSTTLLHATSLRQACNANCFAQIKLTTRLRLTHTSAKMSQHIKKCLKTLRQSELKLIQMTIS